MSRPQLVPAILLVIAAFGFLFLSVRSSTVADEGQEGLTMVPADKVQAAPDWNLREAGSGRMVRLSEVARHSPVVFSFWATWCGPCRDELPHLELLSQKYRGRVAFYGLNSSDPPATMSAFAIQNGLTFPMLSDARREAATRYGAEAIPMLVVVDMRGKVRAVGVGYDPNSNLEGSLSKIIETLLSEPPN